MVNNKFIKFPFLVICTFGFCSYKSSGQVFIDFGISLPSWKNTIRQSDNSVSSNISLKRDKLFDYQIGFQIKGNEKIKRLNLLTAFTKNSVLVQCDDFYGDGQLVRIFNLHYLMLQLDKSFDFKPAGHRVSVDAGISLNKSIFNNSPSQIQYFKPGSLFDASYARYEKLTLRVPNINVGLNIRVTCDAKLNEFYCMKLYCQMAASIAADWSYDWYFMGKSFMNGSANRFSPTFGVQFPFNRQGS